MQKYIATLIYHYCLLYRGEQFRQEFRRLCEVRSLMKGEVHVMALTATATKGTRHTIFTTLGMTNPYTVYRSPERTNFTYSMTSTRTFETELSTYIQQLKVERKHFPKMIIFCQTLAETANIYEYIYQTLGKEFTHPIGAPNIARFRLADMYSSVTVPKVKEQIEESMKTEDSTLRVLICTNAFGIGVDCQGVRTVLHWGPPQDLEAYLQEIGRGGRDGKQTRAHLCYNKKSLAFCDHTMHEFCASTTCRRHFIMSHFVESYSSAIMGSCKCCDVCKQSCACADCKVE